MKPGDGSTDVRDDWSNALLGDDHGLVVVTLERGAVAAMNAAARRLFGRDATGAPMRELFDARSWGKVERALESPSGACELQVRSDGEDEPRPVRFVVLRDGERCLLVAAPSASGTYSRAQGATLMRLNDELAGATRELARRAHDLAKARAELEKVEALREQFMATLAHDLKSPLGALRLTASRLMRAGSADGADSIRSHAARLDRAAVRMTRLIDTVITAVRLEAGELSIVPTLAALDDIARDAIDALQPLADEAGVELSCDASGDTSTLLDPTWMGEVLANLIANAIRHAPHGTAVRVVVTGEDARVRCAVTDRGKGVPPELRGSIFERFRQAGAKIGSAGLGLHIAQRIVAMHGGRIAVDDAPGGGARFLFEIPRRA